MRGTLEITLNKKREKMEMVAVAYKIPIVLQNLWLSSRILDLCIDDLMFLLKEKSELDDIKS